MLLFNRIVRDDNKEFIIFKNILCYCSTILEETDLLKKYNLKTSYVIVQRMGKQKIKKVKEI